MEKVRDEEEKSLPLPTQQYEKGKNKINNYYYYENFKCDYNSLNKKIHNSFM
jgi:hypothetical protein